jgi:hypothetical protein
LSSTSIAFEIMLETTSMLKNINTPSFIGD